MAGKESAAPHIPDPKDPNSGLNETSDSTLNRAVRKIANSAPEQMVELTAMMQTMGPMGHPLHQKMNEQHISKMLDLAVQHDTNEYQLQKNQQEIDSRHENETRRLYLIYFVLFLALLVFVLTLFRNQPTILVPIITGVGGVVAGFMGGLGFGRSGTSGKKKSE